MKNKRLIINLIASIVAFIIQMGINFIITPIIVEKLGDEAYGFIGLASNFISYATILTVALNSLAARFISIEIHKGEEKKANEYYSSVFIANIILSIFIFIIASIMIINLNSIIQIPENLDTDVKITFALAFINFILSLATTVFNVATFVENRLDLSSMKQIIGNVLKVIIIFILFAVFKPKIYFILIATMIYTIYLAIANYRISKKIMPTVKVRKSNFKFKVIKILISSGIWNSVNSLSRMLLTGLDLLIANIFINPYSMGILSIAKTIPSAIEALLATIGNVFTPHFTILYSKFQIKELVKEVRFSIKVMSLLLIVPIAGFIVFGQSFYSLWLPSKTIQEIQQIQILSILTLAPHILSACIYTLYSLDIVTNKLKRTVLVTLGMSVASTITVLILLKLTHWGIYAIAGTSSFFWLLKVIFFTPMNAAYNLKVKLTTFYPPFLRALITLIIIILLMAGVHYFIPIASWSKLVLVAVLVGTIGYIFTFLLILNKEEKNKLINIIKKRKLVEV